MGVPSFLEARIEGLPRSVSDELEDDGNDRVGRRSLDEARRRSVFRSGFDDEWTGLSSSEFQKLSARFFNLLSFLNSSSIALPPRAGLPSPSIPSAAL